jgi:hypothetical protein
MEVTKNKIVGKFVRESDEISPEVLAKRAEYIFPENHIYLTFLKKVFRHELRKSGFRRLSTPVFFEKEDLDKIFDKGLEKKAYI